MKSALLSIGCLLLFASAQVESQPALERDPSMLPRSEELKWSEWSAEDTQPDALLAVVGKMTEAYRAGELPQALGSVLDGLELVPEYPPLLHQGGVVYFKLRRYENSRELFERFLRVAPSLVGQTRALGHCYYTLGDYEQAQAHYERVLKSEPEMVEARRGYALALLRSGDPDGALRELQSVVEQVPAHADAWTWIAQVHFDEDRVEEASASIEKAIMLDIFAPRGWFLKAQIAWELERDEEGDAAHARYRELDRATQEVRALEARLILDPHQVKLLMRLIEAHRSVGNFGQVRNAGARLIREDPAEHSHRIHVLDVLSGLGDAEGAQLCALSLEKIAGDDARAWKRLEQYWNRVGNRRKATEAAERHLRLKYR